MNSLRTVSFEILVECIALSSGDPDAFVKLWLERNDNSGITEITDKGKPCFLIQTFDCLPKEYTKWMDGYATELDLRL